MGKAKRRHVVVAIIAVVAAVGVAFWDRSSTNPTASTPVTRAQEPRAARAAIEPKRVVDPKQREQLARELEAAAEAPPADEYPDAVEAGLIEDANDHMIEAVRPCVRAAKQPVPLHWMARFQYVVVIERDQARLENIETINTNLNDPTLFECVKDAITKLRWRSRGDARISAEMTVPLGSLDGPR